MSQGPDVFPLVDARRRDRLAEALGGLSVQVSKSQLARITAASVARPLSPAFGPGLDGGRKGAAAGPLSSRETEVLKLVMTGMTNRGIARWLGISERTAREHVARILIKLQVRSRVEAAVIATQWRLAPLAGSE